MARQHLGQHFLSSPHILERIAVAACGHGVDNAIEIGPGRGALTEHLLPLARRVIAIEIDPELVALLESRFASAAHLTIVPGDAVRQDLSVWSPDVICGNLPYYVATPILERCVRLGVPIVVLIQKEVAERLTARPGTREYGFLTCQIALFADASYLFTVKAGSFRPPPKVDSAVIRLAPHARAGELGVDEPGFLKFLSACFQHKRKTLRNNLIAFYPPAALNEADRLGRRAEQCSLEELALLYIHMRRAAGGHDPLTQQNKPLL